jgi:hypothetical protein
MDTQARLEELRTILRSESISYDELHELQDLGARGLIDPDDVELLEAAGVPEECGQILYENGKPVAVCAEARYTEHDHEDCKRRKHQTKFKA